MTLNEFLNNFKFTIVRIKRLIGYLGLVGYYLNDIFYQKYPRVSSIAKYTGIIIIATIDMNNIIAYILLMLLLIFVYNYL